MVLPLLLLFALLLRSFQRIVMAHPLLSDINRHLPINLKGPRTEILLLLRGLPLLGRLLLSPGITRNSSQKGNCDRRFRACLWSYGGERRCFSLEDGLFPIHCHRFVVRIPENTHTNSRELRRQS